MKKILFLFVLAIAGIAYGATTFTTNYSFNKPGDGDRNFGSLIRDNWDKADTQLKANETSITNHLSDTVAAHLATAISTTPGANICTTQTTVQAYLDCLDSLLDPGSSGIVLIAGAQTITGVKTFSTAPIFSTLVSGILNTDGAGLVSAGSFGTIDPLTTKGDLLAYDTDSVRLAIGTDGYLLEADSAAATGMAWKQPNPQWRKFTLTFTDFSAAATTFATTAFALAAGEGIEAVVVKHTTAFSGGAISAYKVEVGQTGNPDLYSGSFDIFQAVANTTRRINNVMDVPNFGATTDVVITATATGANLDQASAGSVDVYIRSFVLP